MCQHLTATFCQRVVRAGGASDQTCLAPVGKCPCDSIRVGRLPTTREELFLIDLRNIEIDGNCFSNLLQSVRLTVLECGERRAHDRLEVWDRHVPRVSTGSNMSAHVEDGYIRRSGSPAMHVSLGMLTSSAARRALCDRWFDGGRSERWLAARFEVAGVRDRLWQSGSRGCLGRR